MIGLVEGVRPLAEVAMRMHRYDLHGWRRRNAGRLDSAAAANCLRSLDAGVQVAVDSDGRAHTSGVQRCGSPWACPVCAPGVRATRALEIEDGLAAARDQGLEVHFVTFTVPHHRAESLRDVWDRLADMYRWAWGGRAGQKLRRSNGVLGTIVADEAPHGANGWHVHRHVIFVCEPGEFVAVDVAARWRHAYRKFGIERKYVPHVSVDIREAKSDGVAAYLAKVDGGWSLAHELTRGDIKAGAGATPMRLLERAATGEAEHVRRWVEFEQTSKGRRAIRWSRGLRDRLGQGAEVSDEEAAAGPEADEPVRVVHVPRCIWESYRRADKLGQLLRAIESGEPVPRVTDPPP